MKQGTKPKLGYVDCAGCWDGWDLEPYQKCSSCGRVGWKHDRKGGR